MGGRTCVCRRGAGGLQQLLSELSGRWCHVGVVGRSGHACCGVCMVQALVWGGCMLAWVGDFCLRGCGHLLIYGGGDVCVCVVVCADCHHDERRSCGGPCLQNVNGEGTEDVAGSVWTTTALTLHGQKPT